MKLNLLDREWYQSSLFEDLAWLRNNQPIYCDVNGIWGITRYEDIKWVEKNPHLFSNFINSARPFGVDQYSMADSDDPSHAYQRRMVSARFSARQMQTLEASISHASQSIIDSCVNNPVIDVVKDIATPLPMHIICNMLQLPLSDSDQLINWSKIMLSGADDPTFVTDLVAKSFFEYFTYMSEIIEFRKKNMSDDIISLFIQQGLEDKYIIGNLLLLIIGGTETTSSAISGGLEALIRYPVQMNYVRQSDNNLSLGIEEILRWTTPVLNMNRTATQDVTIHGQTIPAGSQVLIMFISANRDETIFKDAGNFISWRSPNSHISFGWGTHLCLGANLARMELKCLYSQLFHKVKSMCFADSDYIAEYSSSSFVRGITELPICIEN